MHLPRITLPTAIRPTRIAVGVSGGVDSAVAALLVRDSGIPAMAVFLRIWHDTLDEKAIAHVDSEQALAEEMADQLHMPFTVLDGNEAFRRHVVEHFIQSYAHGETPNPCVHCNRHVRWGFMLSAVRELGASHLATGHYARLRGKEPIRLLRSSDPGKDQSYMLSFLDQQQLQHALFPIGELSKARVREIARFAGLFAADRPDSQDLCFIGEGGYRSFLERHAPNAFHGGPIFNTNGEEIGRHAGLVNYTVGQRKGIGIAQPHPLYVVAKDVAQNALIVGSRESLGGTSLRAGPMHWVAGHAPALPARLLLRTRYTAPEVIAEVQPVDSNSIHATLANSVPDITPGQAAVLYMGDECLGGGIIQAC